jgi:Uma2 family endonuclease
MPMPTAIVPKPEPERLLTIEELPEAVGDGLGELIEGRYIPMPPTGWPHASIEARITSRLQQYVDANPVGMVLTGEVGIVIRRDPDTLRGADLAFVSNDCLAQASPSGYLDVAPELVVEIVSPRDRWTEITAKLDDYFSIGVKRVWLLDPRRRRVSCYSSPTELTLSGPGDILTAEPILPGLKLPVADLFDRVPEI